MRRTIRFAAAAVLGLSSAALAGFVLVVMVRPEVGSKIAAWLSGVLATRLGVFVEDRQAVAVLLLAPLTIALVLLFLTGGPRGQGHGPLLDRKRDPAAIDYSDRSVDQ